MRIGIILENASTRITGFIFRALMARRAVSKEARGGYLLSLQLFQNKRPLVETEVKLAPGSPLFIRGPQYGKGQLIIVLEVRR